MNTMIKSIITKMGADICGIANIDRFENVPSGFHPNDLFDGCKSVIVFGKRLPLGLTYVNPRCLYKNANDTCMDELDRIALNACIKLEKMGAMAIPVPSDTPYEYWDAENTEGRGLISLRHAAVLAGIGSMGKNTLVLSKEFGNMLNFGAILTNLDLKSDPLAENQCIENCRICIESCPVGALNGTTVNQKLCRAHTYTTNKRGFTVCNCNTCRTICPKAYGTLI
jgi:epoxyqueuosine reductase